MDFFSPACKTCRWIGTDSVLVQLLEPHRPVPVQSEHLSTSGLPVCQQNLDPQVQRKCLCCLEAAVLVLVLVLVWMSMEQWTGTVCWTWSLLRQ